MFRLHNTNGNRLKNKATANKSLDVRAKQRLCYRSCPLNFGGLGGGFAPRQLRRYMLRVKIGRK